LCECHTLYSHKPTQYSTAQFRRCPNVIHCTHTNPHGTVQSNSVAVRTPHTVLTQTHTVQYSPILLLSKRHTLYSHKPTQYSTAQFRRSPNATHCTHTNPHSTAQPTTHYTIQYSLLPLAYKPVQHVTVLSTVGSCNTAVSIIMLYITHLILATYGTTVVCAVCRPKRRYAAHDCRGNDRHYWRKPT
jgi:hypothetical protein